MTLYKLSVIVPVYNVEKYLVECLNSIVNQTLDKIQIIIVNDGSTDSSFDIINDYSSRYSNIKVINQKNKGLAQARNVGVDNAEGEYITFLDSDDWIEKDMYEKMYNKAKKYECPLVISDIDLVWSNGKIKRYNKFNLKEDRIYTKDEHYKLLLMRKLQCQAVNKIYRTDIWKNSNIRFEEGRYYEDIIPAFIVAKEYEKCMFINEGLYKYRMRDNSITATISEKKIYDLIHAVDKAKLIANKNVCKIDYIDKFLMSFNVNYGTYIFQLAKKKFKYDNDSKIVKKVLDKYFNESILRVILSNKIFIKPKIKYIFSKLDFIKFKFKDGEW